MPGPRGFALRVSAVRLRAADRSRICKTRPAITCHAEPCRVHRIPCPTYATIMIRPPAGRDADGYRPDLGRARSDLFRKIRKNGLTGISPEQPTGKSPEPLSAMLAVPQNHSIPLSDGAGVRLAICRRGKAPPVPLRAR